MRQVFCHFLKMLSTAATIEVRAVYLQCRVLCLVNLLASTVFENIWFPVFLHKLTSISRQNWSCEEIPSSQNSDEAASFSSVVINKNIASSVWNYSKSLRNKIRLFKHHEVFSYLQNINSGIFLYFKKVLTLKLGKTPSSGQWFCFALYTLPSAVKYFFFNNYSLKSRWTVAKYLPRREAAR